MSVKKVIQQIVVLAFYLVTFEIGAQNLPHLYKVAERQFYQEEIREAHQSYEKIASLDPNYKDIKYKTELCLLLLGDAERPLDTILKYRDTKGRADKFYYYWLGRILDYRYQFDDAIVAWQQFLKVRGYKSPEIVAETKQFIKDAKKKREYFETESKLHVVKLGDMINSSEPELTPTYVASAGQLLFASSRGSRSDGMFSIYGIARRENRWGDVAKLTALGQFNEDEANLIQTNNDGELFMYSSHKGGDLYFSRLTNNRWTEPSEFDSKITHTHLGSQFYINEKKNRILFSTDKHAKKSGLDIYQAVKTADGKWSKPVALTTTINSEFDEDNPFLSADGKTLYFSSKGHNSIGGYDIFKSQFDEGTQTWSEPVNLGYPINTPDDEIQFKILPEGNQGFFSSNRLKPVDDFDIYQFYEEEWAKVEGKVYDLVTKTTLQEGEIEFVYSGFGEDRFTVKLDSSGKYNVRIIAGRTYKVNISNASGTITTDEFEVINTDSPTLHLKNFYANGDVGELKSTSLATTIISDDPERYKAYEKTSTELDNLGSKYRVAAKAIIHNIYFDFGASTVKAESHEVLMELFDVLTANPGLRVEIAGHTDNVGPSDINLILSENRAKSVKEALTALGIAADRLVAKGHGETEPIASNDNEREGRELNRRIEVHVIH